MARNLTDLIELGNENLGFEYKAWMDLTESLHRANIARHIAALSNHGGGHLVFGVDDKTRQPLGATTLPPDGFSQDSFSSIVKRYLEPRVQVLVEKAEYDGVEYPVIIVPSHGSRPIISISDGPQDDRNRVQGIARSTIYIRSAGPESVAISAPDDWTGLLDRCLSHRADILSGIFRQSMERESRPTFSVQQMLRSAMDDIGRDFADQSDALAALISEDNAEERAAVLRGKTAHATLGYALLDDRGAALPFDRLRDLARRVSVYMDQYASYGWSSFLILSPPERAPQVRSATINGEETQYLEGMRLENTGVLSSSYDYWRLYTLGMGISVESYVEDSARSVAESSSPHLLVHWALIRIHSILVHARFMGAELGSSNQVMIRMDWRGLTGRRLHWERRRVLAPGHLADDRFATTVTLPWADLRDDYFSALKKVALPLLEIFPNDGYRSPEEWLTREFVERNFAQLQSRTLRLVDDEG